MSDSKNLDLNILANKCLINTDSSIQTVLSALEEFKKNYSDMEVITVFNHFLLVEHRPEILIYLIRELDRYKDSSSSAPLARLLLLKEHIEPYDKIDYTHVRVLCAKAISNLKNHDSVFAILECLNNKNENYKIRLSCADALGRLGDRYAVTPLINIVSDESEKSVYIRESAATALGMLGDIRAADSLVSILETKNGIMDKFSYLKERVIEALNKILPDNDRAFKALKNSLSDESPQVRINAIEAVMNYENEESVNLIKNMLKDDDEEVMRNAVIALYNLEGEDALIEITQSPSYSTICKEEAQKIIDSERESDYEE